MPTVKILSRMCTVSMFFLSYSGFDLNNAAQAQDCSEILKYGIYDISRTSTQTQLIDSYLEWLSEQEVRTDEEARNFSLKVGVVLPTVATD